MTEHRVRKRERDALVGDIGNKDIFPGIRLTARRPYYRQFVLGHRPILATHDHMGVQEYACRDLGLIMVTVVARLGTLKTKQAVVIGTGGIQRKIKQRCMAQEPIHPHLG